MESQEPLVLFCDLCSASVPLQDVDAGRAVRHQGRTFGACCLPALRAVSPPPVAASGSPMGRVAGENRLLPLGVVVLVAIAAAALFLDSRLEQADAKWVKAHGDLLQGAQSQTDNVQGIVRTLDGVARRADLDPMQQRLHGLEERGQREAEARQAAGKEQDRFAIEVKAALAALQDGLQQRDPAPALAELRLQLQQQAVALAELRASPHAREPAPATVDATPPMPAPGLGASLQHAIGKLKDEDAATRFEALDELLRTKDPAVLEFLLPLTKDSDTFVRRLCVEGLKDFHRPEVVDALLVALADPEEFVRDQAWRSLKDLTGQKLPFEAAGSREARARAQQKWQEWWEKNRATFGA